MNPNSISHRLFIAALTPNEQTPGKRGSAVRSLSANGNAKTNAAKSVSSFYPPTSGRVGAWSWSGWQHNTI